MAKKSEVVGCGLVAAWFVGTVLALVARGWSLSLLWGWFVVPLGVAAIGFWHACGISALVTMLVFQKPPKDDDADDAVTKALSPLVTSILLSLFCAGFGWLYQSMV